MFHHLRSKTWELGRAWEPKKHFCLLQVSLLVKILQEGPCPSSSFLPWWACGGRARNWVRVAEDLGLRAESCLQGWEGWWPGQFLQRWFLGEVQDWRNASVDDDGKASHRLKGEREAQRWNLTQVIFHSTKTVLDLLCSRCCGRLGVGAE